MTMSLQNLTRFFLYESEPISIQNGYQAKTPWFAHYYLLLEMLYFAFVTYKWVRHDIQVSFRAVVGGAVLFGGMLTLGVMTSAHLGCILAAAGILLHWKCIDAGILQPDRKAVLITGCDRGIGHELAKKLDSLGYHVFAGCLFVGGDGERQLVAECSRRLRTLQLDVTDRGQVDRAALEVERDLGNNKLWGVVNNAGICYIGNIEIMTAEDIDKIMYVNFMGPVNICRAFLPLLRHSKGRLVNVASNTGLAPVPLMGMYCASKAALATFSDGLRYELRAWGIHVSTIIPSGYRTGILAYDKLATAERWWKSASSCVQNDYGKECFTPKFKMSNPESITSPDLSPIVMTIIHALTSTSPNAYYYSGLLARSLPFFYLHLPKILRDPVMKILGDWFEFKPKALQSQ